MLKLLINLDSTYSVNVTITWSLLMQRRVPQSIPLKEKVKQNHLFGEIFRLFIKNLEIIKSWINE